jgi:hypothetical protein
MKSELGGGEAPKALDGGAAAAAAEPAEPAEPAKESTEAQ